MAVKRPLIGCTTYRRVVSEEPKIEIDGLMPTYTSAILAAGGLPVMIPLTYDDETLVTLFAELDGVLLPGGGDIDPLRYGGSPDNAAVYGVNPLRDHVEIFMAQKAVEAGKPLLAICRGHQVLNVALGGSLWEDVLELMPNAQRHAYFHGYERNLLAHSVRICDDSKLHYIFGSVEKAVNSIHHQGIKRLGAGLTPTAYAPDGLIESVELREHPFALGVQWHPEEFFGTDRNTLALFEAFVAACD